MNEVKKQIKDEIEKILAKHGWEIAVDFYDDNGKLKGLAICEPEYSEALRDLIPVEMMPLAEDDTALH